MNCANNFAYDKVYLERTQMVLGACFDFAVNSLEIDMTEFFRMS